MNDEIKEILDRLEIVARKHTIRVCDDGSKIKTMPASVVDELRLNNFSAKLLLDYITNLQQENEDYKSRCEKANQYIKNNTHEYKMFNEELGHFSNLTNISIDKNNKVFINDLLKILGGDKE